MLSCDLLGGDSGRFFKNGRLHGARSAAQLQVHDRNRLDFGAEVIANATGDSHGRQKVIVGQ